MRSVTSRLPRSPHRNHAAKCCCFADTFNRWFEPENLRAALRVLTAAGYRVRMPQARGRPLCCGRSYLAVGMVEQARGEARRTLEVLGGELPVIGLEPSCLLTLRDEYRALLPGPAADALADRALLLSEFLAREKPELALKPLSATTFVHGHCHQKSFGAFPAALAMLKRIPELEVKPIASSCCGMAGSFGYQAETQDVSRAMAEAGLLPAVRKCRSRRHHRRRRDLVPPPDPRPGRSRGDPFRSCAGAGVGMTMQRGQGEGWVPASVTDCPHPSPHPLPQGEGENWAWP